MIYLLTIDILKLMTKKTTIYQSSQYLANSWYSLKCLPIQNGNYHILIFKLSYLLIGPKYDDDRYIQIFQ